MTLLDFARGPGFEWALMIMVFGVIFRLVGVFLLWKSRDHSLAKSNQQVKAGLHAIASRSLPAHDLEKNIRFQHYSGYAWHIGYFVTLLFFAPHIAFFKGLFGFSWPALPTSVITVTGAITAALLLALIVRRFMHPVLRLISGFDDYFSALVAVLPLISGLMAYAHLGWRYETMLGLHILSIELLMVWYPLSKLMHTFLVFPSRYLEGAKFGRRGVKA